MQALVGIIVLIGIAYLLSSEKKRVSWKSTLLGFAVHFSLAFILLNVSFISDGLMMVNTLIAAVEKATGAGTQFVFGFLGGGVTPFDVTDSNQMFVFAFQVLPQVLIFTVLVALFWHWQILPFFVRLMGLFLSRIFKVKGPLATAGASSLFLGMVESPLVVRAYLSSMSTSDFFAVMTLGMSTVAGSVLVLYASVLNPVIESAVSQIVAASLLNIIGALYISRLFEPETVSDISYEETESSLKYESTMDALAKGTRDGIMLAVNVGAMVLVLVSLVALANGVLSIVNLFDTPLSLERIFGWVFSPIAWLIGIPWAESTIAGSLLGTKLVLNELVAFIQLAEVAPELSEHSIKVLTFALCGFANFGSLGILLGGLYILVPDRREETIRIAPKSILSGTVVTLMSASVVSVITSI
jgi:CNT family concentrative nucleoside transporter